MLVFPVLMHFGNSQTISIECLAAEKQDVRADLWLGNVWLVVGGDIVGNTGQDAQEQIGTAIDALLWSGRNTGQRRHAAFDGMTEELALDIVMWSVYGDSNIEFERMIPHRESLRLFEVLPAVTGPAFDGWEAILIESEETETLVWRRETERSVRSHTFSKGSLWRCAEEAKGWLNRQNDR